MADNRQESVTQKQRLKKDFYTIGDLQFYLSRANSTILKWEKLFGLSIRREDNARRRRIYTIDDIYLFLEEAYKRGLYSTQSYALIKELLTTEVEMYIIKKKLDKISRKRGDK